MSSSSRVTLVLSCCYVHDNDVQTDRGSQIPATQFDSRPMGAPSDTRRGPIGSLSLDRGKGSAARLSPCAPFPRRRTSGPIASHRVEVAPPIGGRHDRYLRCSPHAALRPEPPALLSALCSLLEQEKRISLRFVCERHLIRLRSPPRKVHHFRAFKVRNS